jgi:squalene-hopene/tetraprenyl-beta-curcumene cyclase
MVPLVAAAAITELHVPNAAVRAVNAPKTWKGRAWYAFFGFVDRALKIVERVPYKPLRQRSLRQAEHWVLERLDKSDGLAAIFPPIINTIVGLRCLGYPLEHPTVQSQIAELERLTIEDDETLRVQPCFSAVWDTGLALDALLTAELPSGHPQLVQAGAWLLDREVRVPGDWRIHVPDAPVSGWYFEYANEFYPDCDDTAAVLGALNHLRFPDLDRERNRHAALQRGLRWLLGMQNPDGGWAAFDRACNKEVLTYVPFADHNAMIDPSNEDITGRVLNVLGSFGYRANDPAIGRAVRFLDERQEPDGTWYGRWGCNYIYGTWLALQGLDAVGVDLTAERYQHARQWLHAVQHRDGGWGESPGSYHDIRLKGRGPSTAAQTAWSILTLLTLGDRNSTAVARGLRYLCAQQQPDGSWHDEHWTGTGFPRVFYLRYHLYPTHFPVLALATYRAAKRGRPATDRLSPAIAGGGSTE